MSRVVDISVRHAKTKVSAVSVQRVVHALDKLKGYRCPEGSLSIAFLGDKETAKTARRISGRPDRDGRDHVRRRRAPWRSVRR